MDALGRDMCHVWNFFSEMIFVTSHAKHGLRFIIIRIFFSNLFHFLWKEIEQIERKDSKIFQIKSSLKMSNIYQRLIFCELRHFICHITYDLKRRIYFWQVLNIYQIRMKLYLLKSDVNWKMNECSQILTLW